MTTDLIQPQKSTKSAENFSLSALCPSPVGTGEGGRRPGEGRREKTNFCGEGRLVAPKSDEGGGEVLLTAAVTQKGVLPKERPESAPVDSKVVLPKAP